MPLSAALQLLRFVYQKFIPGVSLPPGIGAAAAVPDATRTDIDIDIDIYDFDQLKQFLSATQGTISQLDIMLGLNCGMYPQDIGRLLLSEIDLGDGSFFWNREKEPHNPFRLHYIFWPETTIVVRRYLNDARL